MKRFLFAAAAACVLTFSAAVQARIVALEIEKSEPFAARTSFGAAGEYVRITGKARGELDPNLPVNKGIINLDKAPRNARGMVEYETDIFILRPADPAKGNGRMLYEVNNRGRKFLSVWLMDAPPVAAGAINDPRTAEHAGNGLFLRLGYTIVWSGWDPDAPRAGSGMAMTVPVATNNGQPIVRIIRDELVSGTRGPQVDAFRLSYAAASLEQSQAKLTVRRKEAYAKVDIPASGWAYADARTIKLLPDGTKPEPGALYEFTYPAKDPKVLGIGYAATRDVVSFLRYAAHDDAGSANPVGAPIRHVLGVGISQSGRYLRDHISQGFNQDEARRKVFDGVLAHISGIGRVFHNAEFGQPFRTNTQHEDHTYPENEFPFAAAMLKDAVTGKAGSLLRGDGFDPLLIEVNTSTEYWQKGASLLHTDPLGRRDVVLNKNARVFMVAGTQHGGRAGLTTAPGPCANPRNPHSPAPVLRALIVALDMWVVSGTAPPNSMVPTIKAGTLVPPDQTGFPAIPGA
ncbi:MAG TPA: alpha/beta hydrolase domain-containing protein, partial [Alphaproteobacteria bacterium]|nr:alpha/beta hydrolase domain-containing protein [Alphaproteobacteria bacterium]